MRARSWTSVRLVESAREDSPTGPEIAPEKRGRSGSGVDEGDTNRVSPRTSPVNGHAYRVERKRGDQWYAKFRLPDGRQVQKRIGPHWSERRTPPPAGTTLAAAFDEWLAYKPDRKIKLSTQIDYENMVTRFKKVFGEKFGAAIGPEEVTPEFRDVLIGEGLSDRTVNKYLTVLHGVFVWAQRRYKLPGNPVANVERRPNAKRSNIDVFSREEILALVRVADSDQDATIFLTAAFTGLRLGALLALRWHNVNFGNSAVYVRQNFTNGRVDTPRAARSTVPMADEVAEALAGLRELRFHDLRHAFGSHAIRTADSREVMEWMGHADLATTQRYLQFKPRQDAARRISDAFRADSATMARPVSVRLP